MSTKQTVVTVATVATAATVATVATTVTATTVAAKTPLVIGPYRISTMTVTANWGAPILLDSLFDQLKGTCIPIGYPDEGILKFEHKTQVVGACHKDLFTNRKMTNKSFFNQDTLILRRRFGSGWKEVNMKLFGNGGIQMTGVPSQEFAVASVEWLLALIRTLPQSPFINVVTPVATTPTNTAATTPTNTVATAATVATVATVAPTVTTVPASSITIQKISVPLINTDYSLNYDINQDNLHRIFLERYNLFSMLEKTIYQGVNTKYYYNSSNKTKGVCACPTFCKGQGLGNGLGECKRITMSIFRTGKIIITGARTMDQINETYAFLNNIIRTHASEVLTNYRV